MAALCAMFVACGGKVIVDGVPETARPSGGSGGAGGAGGAGGSSDPAGGGGSSANCADTTCTSNDGANCSCQRACGEALVRINCALTDTLTQKNVIECVCSYPNIFSGVCYEKPGLACDIDHGCCAKYFSGK